MRTNVECPYFGEKIDLLLRSGKTKYRTATKLAADLEGVSSDYFSRMKSGSRRVSENVFTRVVALTSASGLGEADWYESVETFGQKLGLSIAQVQRILGTAPLGIDFRSRSKDESNISSVFELIGGYWESFYYSVSTYGKRRISHDLVHIAEPDGRGLMPCRVIDGSFVYTGHCFPIHSSFLYFMLEKERNLDEIIVYLMNRPERTRCPELDGVILCTSGGVDDKVAVPCAAKVVFRFLGRKPEEVSRNLAGFKVRPGHDFETQLIKKIAGYIEPEKVSPSNTRYMEVIQAIDNAIPESAIPFALRMERFLEMSQ